MSEKEIKKLIEGAIASLFSDQPDIFKFTQETVQTEWNLTHHLANELHKLLPDFDCDLELSKASEGNRRPDIVFHKRGTNDSNFLVIEVKRDGDASDTKSDLQKIRDRWFGKHLRYHFGATVNLKHDKTSEVVVIANA